MHLTEDWVHSGLLFPSWIVGVGSRTGSPREVALRGCGSGTSLTDSVAQPDHCPGAGGGAGGTEEACPSTQGCGQELPVWFQAGGPAHLSTEKPFMAGLPMREELSVGVTQVRDA